MKEIVYQKYLKKQKEMRHKTFSNDKKRFYIRVTLL